MEEEICSICLNAIIINTIISNETENNGRTGNENIVIPIHKTKCGHYFHAECINQWYRKKNTCPNCNVVDITIRPEPRSQNNNEELTSQEEQIADGQNSEERITYPSFLDRCMCLVLILVIVILLCI